MRNDEDTVILGVRAMLRLAGDDPDRPGLVDTPERVLKAWREMTARPGDPFDLLSTQFDEGADEMVGVGPMPFSSVCEHHLLPFTGHAWFAYIPKAGRVVGLSKIPRLIDHYARRPQVQERLTRQVVEAFAQHVDCDAAGMHVRAVHTCSSLRGVRTEAPMTTSALIGAFRTEPEARAEFLAFIGGR
jgi:GTP cyclohydrolase I